MVVGVLILIIAATGFGAMETLFGVEPKMSTVVFIAVLITSVVSRNWQPRSAAQLTILVSMLGMVFIREPHEARFVAGWFVLTVIGLDASFLIRRLFSFF